jgi:hypothetical protein
MSDSTACRIGSDSDMSSSNPTSEDAHCNPSHYATDSDVHTKKRMRPSRTTRINYAIATLDSDEEQLAAPKSFDSFFDGSLLVDSEGGKKRKRISAVNARVIMSKFVEAEDTQSDPELPASDILSHSEEVLGQPSAPVVFHKTHNLDNLDSDGDLSSAPTSYDTLFDADLLDDSELDEKPKRRSKAKTKHTKSKSSKKKSTKAKPVKAKHIQAEYPQLDQAPLASGSTIQNMEISRRSRAPRVNYAIPKVNDLDSDGELSSAPTTYNSLPDGKLTNRSKDKERAKDKEKEKRNFLARPNFKNLKKKEVLSTVVEINGQSYLPQHKYCLTLGQFPVQYCGQCISKRTGDTCRFIRVRAFPIEMEGDDCFYTDDDPIFIDDVASDEKPELPDQFDLNRPMDDKAKYEIMKTAATSLISIFEEGLVHVQKAGCFQRARELQIRAMCDYCSTGLFASSYMCRTCGFEYCLSCKAVMDDTAVNVQARSQLSQLFTCTTDKFSTVKKQLKLHDSTKMIPVSRFSPIELEEEVKIMREHVEPSSDMLGRSTPPVLEEQTMAASSQVDNSAEERNELIDMKTEDGEANAVQKHDVQASNVKMEDDREIEVQSDRIDVPSHTIATEDKSKLEEAQFLSTWAKGGPIVITNVSTVERWDPNAFIERYGAMKCEIVRCDDQPPPFAWKERQAKIRKDPKYFFTWEKTVDVKDFFETFSMTPEERVVKLGTGNWTLKVCA